MQWALSIDRQLSSSMGLRLSYIANRGVQLPWAPDLNQPAASTTFYSQRPATDRPFPNWDLIYSRDAGANSIYNAFQVELNRRYSSGLSFSTAYTLAKHLADNAGPSPTGYAGETGGGRVTDSLDRRGDRGDVYATRSVRIGSRTVRSRIPRPTSGSTAMLSCVPAGLPARTSSTAVWEWCRAA